MNRKDFIKTILASTIGYFGFKSELLKVVPKRDEIPDWVTQDPRYEYYMQSGIVRTRRNYNVSPEIIKRYEEKSLNSDFFGKFYINK